jgi:hypothetical protein
LIFRIRPAPEDARTTAMGAAVDPVPMAKARGGRTSTNSRGVQPVAHYNYATQKSRIFTEDGQVMFLKIRDNAKSLIAKAGVVRFDKMTAGCTGDSWDMLACADRLVELGELLEVSNTMSRAGQHRLFTSFDC